MSTPLMQVSDITMDFAGLRALHHVGFDVGSGEVTSIIGPNGAGKTTLFNIIAGHYLPVQGQVRFDGQDITGMRSDRVCRRGISRTYQTVRPFPGLSVVNNVKVGLLYGRGSVVGSKADHEAEIWRLLDFVKLGSVANKRAEELIPLERKRLELARALATRPKLLLLDELIAGLTPTETLEMMETLRAINRQGVSILLIEHVMKAVMGLSHHVIVLHHGEKIAEGAPETVAADAQVISAYLGTAS